jgi:hypothetical protein
MLRAGTIAIVALLAIGVSQATSEAPSPFVRVPAPRAALAQLVETAGGSAADVDAARFRYLGKLDDHLQDVAASRLGGGTVADAVAAARRQDVTAAPDGGVSVDVYVSGALGTAEVRLRALGMRVTATSDRAPERMVEGVIPPAALPQAAALGATRAILSTEQGGTSTGGFLTQGDAVIHGPQARATGVTGAGVRVGVISDSIDKIGGGISDSQSSGDLPANVTDLLDDPNGLDEGRAMAEIIYDEAPGISGVAFSSGTLGAASKASSIDALVANGVKVIADDVYYPGEPFFQDGIVSQAVDRAKANGVAYLAAAGNEADHSWEGAYTPVPDPSTFHSESTEDFDPGPGVDTVQSIGTVPANTTITLALQWAESWGHATSDFAIDVYNTAVQPPAYAFTIDSNNIANGIPAELGGVHAGASAATFGIAIRRISGTGTPLLKLIDFTDNAGTVNIEHATHSGAIAPDAAAASGALAVAAVRYTTPTTPEGFSSRGPVTRLFDANGNVLATPDVRNKPDLAGPDGVSTSVPGPFVTFNGTSAAAPAVAGIAALLLSANRTLSVDALYAILRNPANATACATSQPAIDCGVGLVLADKALVQGRDTTPPVVVPILSPAVPDGANGWFRGPLRVSWSVTDPESPIADPGACPATDIPDGALALTCSATSAGGTTTVPVSVKRDSTPPSAPTITGIAAQTYAAADLPDPATIGCTASDETSGVTGCVVSGFDAGPGAHTLTATATDAAGLTSSSTLEYVVPAPAPTPSGPGVGPSGTTKNAIGSLSTVAGISLTAVAASGVPVTVRVATPATRLVVTLVARLPKASGNGTQLVTLGTLTTRAGAGIAHLRVRLTASARRRIARLRRLSLEITVAGSASGAKTARLRRSIVFRR